MAHLFRRTTPIVVTLAFAVAWAAATGLQNAAAQPDRIAQTIESSLQSEAGVAARDVEALRTFYNARQYRPAWYDVRGFNDDGKIAIDALAAAADEGLDPARYELMAISKPLLDRDPITVAYRDLMLTVQILHYSTDVREGRDELKHLDPDTDLPPNGFDAVSALSQALRQRNLPEYFRTLPPQSATYAALKSALARYRNITVKGGWQEMDPVPKFDAKSASAEMLDSLQRRLMLEDTKLAASTPPSVPEIDSAIRRFQVNNGLDADGVVGKGTVSVLNIPAAGRVAQIVANMERLRWLPHVLEDNYVAVNVPDATLIVVDKGVEALVSRAIVGRPADRTPIFRAMITQVVANPPWIVPGPIARKEILPKLKSDRGYLAKHQMIIADGHITQLPGASNALGNVKLNVSDRFAVYLHDTPSRSLFARSARFLSHGCIRVQQITPLASFAMTGNVTNGVDILTAAIATGQTVRLPIKAPMPLYVNYFTVFLSADGALQFRRDIYGRDARLIAAIGGTSFTQASGLAGGCGRRT